MHTHRYRTKKKIQSAKRINGFMGTLSCEKILNRLRLSSLEKKLFKGEHTQRIYNMMDSVDW